VEIKHFYDYPKLIRALEGLAVELKELCLLLLINQHWARVMVGIVYEGQCPNSGNIKNHDYNNIYNVLCCVRDRRKTAMDLPPDISSVILITKGLTKPFDAKS
jgi:hypothetical protein